MTQKTAAGRSQPSHAASGTAALAAPTQSCQGTSRCCCPPALLPCQASGTHPRPSPVACVPPDAATWCRERRMFRRPPAPAEDTARAEGRGPRCCRAPAPGCRSPHTWRHLRRGRATLSWRSSSSHLAAPAPGRPCRAATSARADILRRPLRPRPRAQAPRLPAVCRPCRRGLRTLAVEHHLIRHPCMHETLGWA